MRIIDFCSRDFGSFSCVPLVSFFSFRLNMLGSPFLTKSCFLNILSLSFLCTSFNLSLSFFNGWHFSHSQRNTGTWFFDSLPVFLLKISERSMHISFSSKGHSTPSLIHGKCWIKDFEVLFWFFIFGLIPCLLM